MNSIVGKTVSSAVFKDEYNINEGLTITFTDGSKLHAYEYGQVGQMKVFIDEKEIKSDRYNED